MVLAASMKPRIAEKTQVHRPESVRRFSKAKAVADRLGLCPRTIFRWADCGKLTRHKVNARVVLFDEAEVEKLIDSARVTAC
jgi:hypothetical protein